MGGGADRFEITVRCWRGSSTVTGPGSPGGTCLSATAPGRRCGSVRLFSGDGTWDKIHTALLAQADEAGLIDWEVSIDSTINRAHQPATNLTRATGGPGELHESPPGAA